MSFAAPADDSLSSKVMNAETMITDCISQQNLRFLASTSSFGLTCDGKTFFGKKGGSSTGMIDFLWSEKAGLCLNRILTYVSPFFISLFLLRKYWG